MSKIKIYGKHTASKAQGSDKMIITSLNSTELKKAFGNNGQYASPKSIIFDGTSDKFYYLNTFNTNEDATNPNNWKPVKGETASALEWTASPYNKGSLVSKTETNGSVKFYFSTMDTIASDMPSASSKWFEIPTGNSDSTIPRQIVYGSIDKTTINGNSRRKMSFNVTNDVSLNGNRIPTVQVLIRTIEDKYEIAYPKLSFTKSSQISCNIEFIGDLSFLHEETNNVVVTLI